ARLTDPRPRAYSNTARTGARKPGRPSIHYDEIHAAGYGLGLLVSEHIGDDQSHSVTSGLDAAHSQLPPLHERVLARRIRRLLGLLEEQLAVLADRELGADLGSAIFKSGIVDERGVAQVLFSRDTPAGGNRDGRLGLGVTCRNRGQKEAAGGQ